MSHQPRIDLREQARNLYLAGNSLGMIVKALGVPKTTVHRWVTSQDGPRAPPPTRPGIFIPPSPDVGRHAPGGHFVPAARTVPSVAPTYHSPNQASNPFGIAAWQMPGVNSIMPSPPSTLIVPPPDSMQQVMLDLIRAKGYAIINQQHQPQTQQNQPQPPPAIAPQPETPPDARSRYDEEDWRHKIDAGIRVLRQRAGEAGTGEGRREIETSQSVTRRLRSILEETGVKTIRSARNHERENWLNPTSKRFEERSVRPTSR